MCAHVCVCVRDVFAIYDNNTLPMLMMIIIKIISLYFIEIAHTDDFPSETGNRLVNIILPVQNVLTFKRQALYIKHCYCQLVLAGGEATVQRHVWVPEASRRGRVL